MVRFTVKTLRGLSLLKQLIHDGCDDSKPPMNTLIARMTKKEQSEVNQALAWIDFKEACQEIVEKQSSSTVPNTPETQQENP